MLACTRSGENQRRRWNIEAPHLADECKITSQKQTFNWRSLVVRYNARDGRPCQNHLHALQEFVAEKRLQCGAVIGRRAYLLMQ